MKIGRKIEPTINQPDNNETAKTILDICKHVHLQEDARLKAIDAKIYYIFTISGALLAVISFIFGKEGTITYSWYILYEFLIKILIILGATSTIVLLLIGIFSRDLKVLELSKLSKPEFISESNFNAIYKLIVTFEDAINKNKKVINDKVLFLKIGCITLIATFGLIGIKLIMDIVVSFLDHIS